MSKEIERRFILSELPDGFTLHQSDFIRQAYVCVDEASAFEERVRYRLTPDGRQDYLRVQKQGAGLTRTETETPLSREEWAQAMIACLGRPIIKGVYHEQYNDQWIEFHIFYSHRPLMTIEVEFKTEDDGNTFTPPSWFGREVTNDRRYNSASVALIGIPDDFCPNDKLLTLFYGVVGPVTQFSATQ